MKKNENGITLVVLTITIIVLIILAGITVYNGKDSIQKANLEGLKTNMLLIETKAREYVENASFDLGIDPQTATEEMKLNAQNELTGEDKGTVVTYDDDISGELMNIGISEEDIREGITAVVSVKVKEPQFEGQTKTKLGNSEVTGVVQSMVNEALSTFLEENPSVAKAILDKCISASRAREAARKARELVRKKSSLETSTLPGKLADCSSKNADECEVYIVEGDSAGGSAKQGRDRKFQAILPLWGKMLNVEKARADKIYGNDKLNPVIVAIGAGIGAEFDITKIRYGKVIIMADADVDGAHIRTLLLTFFFRYMRPLIENGNVYLAQPPLYKLSKKGMEDRYCYTDEDLEKAYKELEEKGITRDSLSLQRYKGLGEMNPEQLWDTTMNPETRILIKVTMDDAIKADEIFTLLMGDEVEPRREFIQQNAKYVKNLDI